MLARFVNGTCMYITQNLLRCTLIVHIRPGKYRIVYRCTSKIYHKIELNKKKKKQLIVIYMYLRVWTLQTFIVTFNKALMLEYPYTW